MFGVRPVFADDEDTKLMPLLKLSVLKKWAYINIWILYCWICSWFICSVVLPPKIEIKKHKNFLLHWSIYFFSFGLPVTLVNWSTGMICCCADNIFDRQFIHVKSFPFEKTNCRKCWQLFYFTSCPLVSLSSVVFFLWRKRVTKNIGNIFTFFAYAA